MRSTASTWTRGWSRALKKAEAIVVSIPPREGSGATLERFAAAIDAAADLRRVVYYSTIGVYGDHGGGWVDETSATLTRTFRGLARLEDEARWTAAARARGVEADILRLAGIYGPGRNALVNLRQGQARRIVKPGQVFNRAHVDDIAELTRLVLTRDWKARSGTSPTTNPPRRRTWSPMRRRCSACRRRPRSHSPKRGFRR